MSTNIKVTKAYSRTKSVRVEFVEPDWKQFIEH